MPDEIAGHDTRKPIILADNSPVPLASGFKNTPPSQPTKKFVCIFRGMDERTWMSEWACVPMEVAPVTLYPDPAAAIVHRQIDPGHGSAFA